MTRLNTGQPWNESFFTDDRVMCQESNNATPLPTKFEKIKIGALTSTRAKNRVQNILNSAIGENRPSQIVDSSKWTLDVQVDKISVLSLSSADNWEGDE